MRCPNCGRKAKTGTKEQDSVVVAEYHVGHLTKTFCNVCVPQGARILHRADGQDDPSTVKVSTGCTAKHARCGGHCTNASKGHKGGHKCTKCGRSF